MTEYGRKRKHKMCMEISGNKSEWALKMKYEFIKNPDTGTLEAWEDGKVVGVFISTGMMARAGS